MKEKLILDACCGGRMFWFNKKHPNALYVDQRKFERQVIWKKGKEKREFLEGMKALYDVGTGTVSAQPPRREK